MRRFVAFQVLPVLGILALTVLPMAAGRQTLYQRDVMNAHLPAKAAQAEAFADLELPLVDSARGHQPLLGNPNSLTLYPDSLLLLIDPIWALNAHFWLHWLLAPFAFAWLARACGLSRPAAWAGGVLYGTSGYFLSLMNLFNLIPAAVWTPALIAALLRAAEKSSPARWSAVGLVWALLLLSGDPFSVVLATALAGTALLALRATRPDAFDWKGLAIAVALGSACAAPLAVEFLRILPISFRAAVADQTLASLTQSVAPLAVIEWFWPLVFGPHDFSFWGPKVYDQGDSLFYSLFPGMLAWALLAAAGRPHGNPAARWAWAWLIAGLLLVFGRHNPLVAALYELPGVPALRFPIKFWLLAAIAGALLAAFGFERFLGGEGRRTLSRVLVAFGGLYGAAFLILLFAPDLLWQAMASLDAASPATFDAERLRLMGNGLKLAAGAFLLAGATVLHRRNAALAGSLLLALHTVFQLDLLAPLVETDDAELYRQPPPIAAAIEPGAIAVHGGFDSMFGRTPLKPRERFPDLRHFWLNRCRHLELGPPTAALLRRPYDLAVSPEGLDSYFAVLTRHQLEKAADDPTRFRALAALGIDYVILDRPLAPVEGVRRVATIEDGCTAFSALYRLERASPAYQLVGRKIPAPSARAAFDLLADPAFDGRTTAVVAGVLDLTVDRPPGRILKVDASRHAVEAEVESPEGGVFVTRRAFLPFYRAEIDGHAATPVLVNAYRLGLEVPAGHHRLRLEVDRRPTRIATAVGLAGLLALIAFGLSGRGARRHGD